ncbi:MAG: hypothetical protein HQL90_07295 [Magnetococcales bacterium]|nr:hypothetical protein [Magnetococcales bacterium]
MDAKNIKVTQGHEEIRKLIKAREVRDRFGGVSASTLYRYWHDYKILPPPAKIRGICFWSAADVEWAVQQVVGAVHA